MDQSHSIYFYLLMGVMSITVLISLTVGSLFFLKSTGSKRGNNFFGLLQIAFGLTLFHNILMLWGVFDAYPQWKFLPIYFTLTFPVFTFYYVKCTLYPQYRLKWSDFKHFLLPISQLIFFVLYFIRPVADKINGGRSFYNPFFGAFEQTIYILSFLGYLYFSDRYIRHRKSNVSQAVVQKQIWYLKKFVKVLLYLFLVHLGFIVIDYAGYEIFNINLQSSKPFAGMGAMSFTAMVIWLNIYGFQVLIWGRRIFPKQRIKRY